jgi:hypothetical protein
MNTMDDQYGDGSACRCCTECGYCIDCGDCEEYGCGEEAQ